MSHNQNLLKKYNLFVGTNFGSLLYIQDKKPCKVIKTHEHANSKQPVTSMQFGRNVDEIVIGYNNGDIKLYDVFSDKYFFLNAIVPKKIVSSVNINQKLFAFTATGSIIECKNYKMKLNNQLDIGDTLIRSVIKDPVRLNCVALGGANYDAKIYDIESKTMTFETKNDRNDHLNLPQHVSVTGIAMFSEYSGISMATVTTKGQVRVYDIRAQRKPIKMIQLASTSFTCVTAKGLLPEILVGCTRGQLTLFDLRHRLKPLTTFKEYMGSVMDIDCEKYYSYAASVSLDRFLKVHDLYKKQLVYTKYLKAELNQVLIRQIPNPFFDNLEHRDMSMVQTVSLPMGEAESSSTPDSSQPSTEEPVQVKSINATYDQGQPGSSGLSTPLVRLHYTGSGSDSSPSPKKHKSTNHED